MDDRHGLPRLRQEQWHFAGGEEEGDEPVELVGWQMAREQVVIQAVRRNPERFPADFMFRLATVEAAALRSQTVISNVGRGGRRYLPYAFTEQGVAMLSSVLRSNERSAAAVAKIVNGLLGQGFGHDDIVILTLRGSAESIFSDRERVGPYVLRRFTQGYDLFGNQLMTPGKLLFESVRRFKGPAGAGHRAGRSRPHAGQGGDVQAAALLRYDAGDRAAGACGQGGQPAQPVTTEPRVNVAANVRGRGRVGLASALR